MINERQQYEEKAKKLIKNALRKLVKENRNKIIKEELTELQKDVAKAQMEGTPFLDEVIERLEEIIEEL